MPNSLLIRGSDVDRHLSDWLGNDGTYLIRQNAQAETVIRYASREEAQEALAEVEEQDEAQEETLTGPFTAAECRTTVQTRVDQTSQVRFTQWLELAVEVEPFQLAFHEGLTARLQLLHIDNYVPCTWGTAITKLQVHTTRERVDEAWTGTLQLRAGSNDTQTYKTETLDLDFDMGEWDQYLFHTLQFRPQMGPCRLSVLLEDTLLDSIDIEIVDEMPRATINAESAETRDPFEGSVAKESEGFASEEAEGEGSHAS